MVSDTLKSQGLRPFDPYTTLRVHPHAPRPVIVAVYWVLVERWKARAPSPAAEQALTDLNAAYQILIDADARRAYDQDHGPAPLPAPRIRIARRRSGVLGLGSTKVATTTAGYYYLLSIDREADDEIIDLAHAVLASQLASHSVEDRLLRQLLDEAHRTLRDPKLRAQYDLTLKDQPLPATPAPSAPAASSSPEPTSAPIDTLAEVEAVPVAESLTAEPHPAAAPRPHGGAGIPRMFRRDQTNGAAEPAPADEAAAASAEAEPIAADAVTEPEPAARPEPPPDVPATPALAGPVARVATATRRGGGLLHRLRLGVNHPSAPHVPRNPPPAEQQRLPAGRDVEAARDERILTLRVPGDAPAREEPAPGRLPEDDVHEGPELIFVAGPFTGSRVSVGKHALTLGSSASADIVLPGPGGRVALEHARIWQHGDHVVFRQLDGAETEICGQKLLLPLVMLEDGDEIQIGPHRMRFSTARSAQPPH